MMGQIRADENLCNACWANRHKKHNSKTYCICVLCHTGKEPEDKPIYYILHNQNIQPSGISYEAAVKMAEDYAKKFPGTIYKVLQLLGEASTKASIYVPITQSSTKA